MKSAMEDGIGPITAAGWSRSDADSKTDFRSVVSVRFVATVIADEIRCIRVGGPTL
jgi:hypothetical protein